MTGTIDNEPLFRTIKLMRFLHEPTKVLYHKVVALDLYDETVTVEPDDVPYIDKDHFLTFHLSEGILDSAALLQDMNNLMVYQNDIVAIFYTEAVNGKLGDTTFTPNLPSDVIKHPQKKYDYFLSPVKFSRGTFYIINPKFNFTVPLSSIPQPFIEVVGNLHLDRCLIPEPLQKPK